MILTDFGKDFEQWLKIVKSEIEGANSRSVVIVCASILDTQLENLLKKALYVIKTLIINYFWEEMQYYLHLVQKLHCHIICK